MIEYIYLEKLVSIQVQQLKGGIEFFKMKGSTTDRKYRSVVANEKHPSKPKTASKLNSEGKGIEIAMKEEKSVVDKDFELF